MKPLTRGQVAGETDLDIETVRFYERQGLLAEPPRNAAGYRQYSQRDVERLRFIKRAKALGFSLREISDLITLRETPGASSADVRARAKLKILAIEAKLRALAEMKEALAGLIDACSSHTVNQAATNDCPIMENLTGKEVGYGDKA